MRTAEPKTPEHTTQHHTTQHHFDEISDRYDSEIPEHIRLHLLQKKTRAMLNRMQGQIAPGARGLDCGCGTGHYLGAMAAQDYRMAGIEYSQGMLDQAIANNPAHADALTFGSITEIPHPDASFDFAYTINVLHHLPDLDHQITAVTEMLRVTRPGGLVMIQDFDADNPAVRFYMNVIFPLTSNIDDDETEIWVSMRQFRKLDFAKARWRSSESFTLLPNVMPRLGFGAAAWAERLGETLTARKFGAHFLMTFERLA